MEIAVDDSKIQWQTAAGFVETTIGYVIVFIAIWKYLYIKNASKKTHFQYIKDLNIYAQQSDNNYDNVIDDLTITSSPVTIISNSNRNDLNDTSNSFSYKSGMYDHRDLRFAVNDNSEHSINTLNQKLLA
jgi:hypothetical protein